MDDLIRRRDVIEHLKKRLYETALNSTAEHPYYEEIADNRVDIWMNELPSAQPEIIRCNDGKWDMFCFGHCGKVENIIAWMPLPEPYREGE